MTAGSPTLGDIFAARRRLAPYLPPTPLHRSRWLSVATGASVHLKIESLQLGRSFKIRGALNAALKLREATPAPRTMVAASAGNHGQAIAVAARLIDGQAIVCTPRAAPETKKAAIRGYGAVLHDDFADYDAAEAGARRLADELGAPYISPYNHADVIAGAGTIALELLEAMPALDAVIIPVGGGGLAGGMALAIRSASARCTVIGVEVAASTPFATSLARGEITSIAVGPSLADGLVGNLEAGAMTFELVRRHVDRLVSVSEDDLARAIRGLAAEEHLIAEGAGAAATAAALARSIVARDQRVVVMLTGGNMDLGTLVPLLGT